MSDFLESAPSAEVVFARTYSRRKDDGSRENFEEAMLRTVDDISRIGKFTPEEYALVKEQALAQHSFPSGRAFWVAGTEWSKQPKNFYGYYNCSNVHVEDIEAFGIMMDLAMQGTGTGAILEQEVVSKLPKVTRKLILKKVTDVGTKAGDPDTKTYLSDETMIVMVGDSREGWRKAYMNLLYQATAPLKSGPLDVYINLEQVRPSGTKLKGFGGTANPVKLPEMFGKVINILNGAVGRQLTPVECCLIIDEAATCVVAGNIRRSAGMRQFSKEDQEAANAKLGLYRQDENGKWSVDPVKEALRMANHTRCYHTKPSYEEVEAAVRLQFQSGEGAIQYVPEAIARANVDILSDKTSKQMFLDAYTNEGRDAARQLLNSIHQAFTDNPLTVKELNHRMDRYGLNPCLTGDTPILTVHQGAKTFEELVAAGEDVLVWCVNKETNEAAVRMMRNPRITGYSQPILEVEFDSGLKVRATHNHNFFTLQRNKVQAKDLKVGQSVSAFAIHQHRNGHLCITRNNKLTDSVRQQFCHRVIAEYHGIEGEVIHHVDGDPTNNMPGNLEATTASGHNREHYADRCRNGFYHGIPGPAAAEHIANHKVVAIRDAGTATVYNGTVDEHHNYVVVDPSPVGKSYVSGILSANCGEIISRDFMCNLAEVHLNTIDPSDVKGQEDAFYAAGLQVAALLQHEFTHERLQYSRSIDPIVGVSFTGLWDHLMHSYGSEWLEWMMNGCPEGDQRKKFRDGMITKFVTWRAAAHRGVEDYCRKHGLRLPNRITTVQPAGTKSLLTGASSGWHPPKAQRFIRRITLGAKDPLVPALIEHGYSVIPAQSARDEEGNLLDDITDPRVQEVLVEIPTEVSWANLPGCDKFDLAQLPIEAQWELYMLVQQCYCDHNTSATLEIRENEIETLAKLIYTNIQTDGGYISTALLARFDVDGGTFPRLPFEPIDKDTYEALRLPIEIVQSDDTRSLLEILEKYDSSDWSIETVSGCANAACVAKADADERERML